MRKGKNALLALALAGCLFALGGCSPAVETAAFGETAVLPETAEETPAEETAQEEETETDRGREPEETAPETAQREEPEAERPKVKGIYVTGPMAGTSNMDHLIDLVDQTELNALVIDVKNDEGRVVYEMDCPTVRQIGAVRRYVKDMPALIEKCREKGIYLIARIVAFKDPFLAEAKPEWSLHRADGTVFRDKDGLAWVNPYEEGVWDYLVEVGLQAAADGFDEVQFDYIRFSTDSGMKQVDFGPKAGEKSRSEVIAAFTAYACERLQAAGVAVSADVYGTVIDSETDQQIVGQDYLQMTRYLDAISPMVYPSHYGPNAYRIPVPDARPYDTVLAAMQASRMVLAGLDPKARAGAESVSGNGETLSVSENGGVSAVSGNETGGALFLTDEAVAGLEPLAEVRAAVRPWLQDFTATWVKGHISYGPEQLRAQIQAVYDAGYEEWILWNAANRYTEDGLERAESGEGL